MKIEKNFLILCENFIVDDKGRASLINLYDIVFAQSFPAVHPLLKYVFNLKISESGSSKTIKFSFSLTDNKDGSNLFEVKDNSAQIMPKQKLQNVGGVIDVQTPQFSRAGSYTAKLLVNGALIAEHVLEVRKIPEPEK